MSLKTIRAKCLAKTGTNTQVSTSGTDDFSFIDRLINDGAEELYRMGDLVGACKEYLMKIPASDTKIIALPAFVSNIRGLRWYDSQRKIALNTPQARYQNDSNGKKIMNWRDLDTSPLMVQINNSSTLTFRIPILESSAIEIAIVGSTTNSSKVEEKITIAAGEFEAETINNFVTVSSITKAAFNTYDITVLDAEDAVLTVIPNNALQPIYRLIQIRDDLFQSQDENCSIEVLYKEKFVPMVSDNDQFLDGRYDDAVYWKFLEGWYAFQKDSENARLAMQKAAMILDQMELDNEISKDKYIQFGENPNYGMFGQCWTRY